MAEEQYPTDEKTKIAGIIYVVTCVISGKQYVGQTIVSIDRRWKGHLSAARRTKNGSAIYNAIRKYGESAFMIEEIDRADSIERLNELEQMHIAGLRTIAPGGYNLTSGGKNHSVLPETRAKISASLMGHIGCGKGEQRSLETRMKIGISLKDNPAGRKGTHLSDDHKAKLRIAMLGNQHAKDHKCSDERKSRLREIMIGNQYARGYKHSDSAKAKIGAASKRQINVGNRFI